MLYVVKYIQILPKTISRQSFETDDSHNTITAICKAIASGLCNVIPENHVVKKTAAFQAAIQMLREFVKNSIDATARRLSITVEYSPEKNETQVIFEDNGCGFNFEKPHQYFPFIDSDADYKTYNYRNALLSPSPKKDQHMQGGAYLGLAIVSHYLEKYGHHGELHCKNVTGGACIVLCSRNVKCTKEISCVPDYKDEMIVDFYKSMLCRMQRAYGNAFDISLEEFKAMLLNILKNPALDLVDVLRNQSAAQVVTAFNPFRLTTAMSGRDRPRPLNPCNFGLVADAEAYAKSLQQSGVIKNVKELEERCMPMPLRDYAQTKRLEYWFLPVMSMQEVSTPTGEHVTTQAKLKEWSRLP